jgi:hypothetical protein
MLHQRPLGLTIIVVEEIIAGIICVLLGALLFILMPVIANNIDYLPYGTVFDIVRQILTSNMGYVISSVLVVRGFADIIITIGILKAKSWAWKSAVALAFIWIPIDVIIFATVSTSYLAGAIMGGIIDVIILYCLYRSCVKDYFCKLDRARYLKQYDRLSLEEKLKIYHKCEPCLNIHSNQGIIDDKDKRIAELEVKLERLAN